MIADTQWLWLAEQYPYVRLHEHVIMPNHMHGILEIDSGRVGSAGEGQAMRRGVRATCESPVPREPPAAKIKIKSLSELIGAYKTTTSKQIHLAGDQDFKWHRSFHDHIIRDARGYQNISAYIQNNPAKWEADKFYSGQPIFSGYTF